MYKYEEVLEETLRYYNNDELAANVWIGKYALKNEKGEFLEKSPIDMHKRLAKEFARIEKKYENPLTENEILEYFLNHEIVAQGSPMSAIGNPYQIQSLSNCFVIESPVDSYGGITNADQEQAQIMKRRGGVGFDISNIRPKGLPTTNAAKTTDGIVLFMERFSNTCREVAQGGRRGALMLTISCAHPQIREFINIKKDRKKVTGANISIRLTDEFMNAVKNKEKFQLKWPVDSNDPKISEWIDASELWDEIITAAHDCAEPGLLFWDNVVNYSPGDAYEKYRTISTNPCGELVLPAYDSCRLMLMNLSKFVKNPFLADATFDYDKFSKSSFIAQRLMDDLVDLEIEAVDKIIDKIKDDPEPEKVKRTELELWEKIKEVATSTRRTGLGITALGDTIAMLGHRYGSEKSIEITESIYKCLALASYRSSVNLAKERGPFLAYDFEIEHNHPFIQRIMNEDEILFEDYKKYGRRNIANTTTSPAGSVSTQTQTTSGCEPVFLLSYDRRKKINPNDKDAKVDFVDDLGDKWMKFEIYHHGFKKWMEITGETDVEKSPYYKATSADIDWVNKIKMQAAAQKWVCHSISSTTNLPKDTTVETVKEIYMQGWLSGCKGLTIYRDGCRDGVLLNKDNKDDKNDIIVETNSPPRPQILPCDIHRTSVKGEQYMVLVGLLNDKPYEIFCGLSKNVEIPKKKKQGKLIKNGLKDGISTYNLEIPIGDDDNIIFKDIVNTFDNPLYGTITRTLSLSLRHGVPVQFIAEQLKKDKYTDITSFSSAISRILLKNYVPDGTITTSEKKCPECNSTKLAYQSGCVSCVSCGYSKCM